MKARHRMTCECCKSPIIVGQQYSMHAGRPWLTKHLVDYKRRRIAMRLEK